MSTFDLNNKNEGEQLSFDQLESVKFQTSNLDFITTESTARNKDYSYALLELEEKESKTGRFISLSAVLHLSLVVLASMVVIPVMEKSNVETITIEIQDSAPANRGASVPMKAQEETLQALQPKPSTAPEKAISKNDILVAQKPAAAKASKALPKAHAPKKIAAAPHKSAPAKKVAALNHKTVARALPKAAAHTSRSHIVPLAQQSPIVVPQTLDDISAPDLDDSAVKNSTVGSLDDSAFSDDLQKVDQHQKKIIALEQKRLQQDADQMAEENDQALAAVEKENQAEKARIAALNQERRSKEAQEIAAASASELAAKRQAAQAAAAQAAAAAKAQRAEGVGSGHGGTSENSAQQSHGNAGALAGESAGSPKGTIRQLQDLRQMPGNRKPEYDVEERLRGDQGAAVFLAYITKDGRTSQFRLVKSSGFRNLDSKTLAALKEWRFYPGQEGWVEMPIQWDLKGGVQERPTLLRRSRNN